MTATALVASLTVGAALLALWLDARFPRLAPTELRRVVTRLVAAAGVMFLAPSAFDLLLGDSQATSRAMAGIFGVLLPVLTYSFMSAVWLFRVLQSALPAR